MLTVYLRDLQRRWVRFSVVVVLTSLVLGLLFVMTGLVNQFNAEPFDAVDAIGATGWVLPEGVPSPITAVAALPVELADQAIAAVAEVGGDEIGAASSLVVARASLARQDGDEEVLMIGHELMGIGSPPIIEGRGIQSDLEVVADASAGSAVGDTVQIGGREVSVVGLTTDATVLAGIPLVFTGLSTAQEVAFGTNDVVSAVVLGGSRAPVELPAGLHLVPASDVAEDALGPLEGAISTIDLVRVLLWSIAAVVIGGVMYLQALERSGDIAVMRAVGARTSTLMTGLGLQAVIVGLLGVIAATGFQAVIGPAFPLRVRVPAEAFWQVPIATVVVALAASAVAMWRVTRIDPVVAFAQNA